MVNVSFRCDPDLIKHIKRMSHRLSIERDEDLSSSDLIREALYKIYPLPEKEGKYAKYKYNQMLRRPGYGAPEGAYTIQERP